MDESSSSLIRRTKFSHTVCHRIDSSILASMSLRFRTQEIPQFKPRPETPASRPEAATLPEIAASRPELVGVRKVHESNQTQVLRHPLTNKQRTVSPPLEVPLSDTFKDAQMEVKRSLTPISRRKKPDKKTNKSIPDSRKSNVKFGWGKYFDHGGGRVTAVEAADEYMVDLSQLFLGLRFAHGAHSRLYHGKYKDEPVAVKIIRVPDDDENGSLAARLEKQFNREVTLLSRLHHPNVIKVILLCYSYSSLLLVLWYRNDSLKYVYHL